MPPRWGWSCIHTTTTHGSRHGLVSTAPFGVEIVTMDLTAFIGLAHPAGTAQDKPPKLSCSRHRIPRLRMVIVGLIFPGTGAPHPARLSQHEPVPKYRPEKVTTTSYPKRPASKSFIQTF